MIKGLAKIILVASLALAGCAESHGEKKAESTFGGDSYVKSSVFGLVLSSKVQNNQVVNEPYVGPDYDADNKAYVHLIGTNFETETLSGNYYMQGIPVGLYQIEAQPDKISYEIHPYASQVVYISQIPTEAPDLRLITEPIITGKVRNSFGNPVSGLVISLNSASSSVCFDDLLYSAATSSDGSYAFLRSKYGHGDLDYFCFRSNGHALKFARNNDEKKFIPFQYDIVNEDLIME